MPAYFTTSLSVAGSDPAVLAVPPTSRARLVSISCAGMAPSYYVGFESTSPVAVGVNLFQVCLPAGTALYLSADSSQDIQMMVTKISADPHDGAAYICSNVPIDDTSPGSPALLLDSDVFDRMVQSAGVTTVGFSDSSVVWAQVGGFVLPAGIQLWTTQAAGMTPVPLVVTPSIA